MLPTPSSFNPTGLFGRSSQALVPTGDGFAGGPRLDRFNESWVYALLDKYHAAGLEGSLYVATTPTPGTGITLTAATGTSFSDTNAIIGVNNLSTGASLNGAGKDVIPLWLKLIITAAGTAGTDSHVASRLDTASAARSSGGTQLTGKPVSGSYGSNDSIAGIFAGAISVAAASTNVRNMGRAEVRKAAAPAYVAGDVIMFTFGSIENVAPQAITPTTAVIATLPLPPVVIGPGQSWVLNEWMTSRTAAQSAEVEFGYLVR